MKIYLGFLIAESAKDKGENFKVWWAYGFVLTLISLYHLSKLEPPDKGKKKGEMIFNHKVCSNCQAQVPKATLICSSCSAMLN